MASADVTVLSVETPGAGTFARWELTYIQGYSTTVVAYRAADGVPVSLIGVLGSPAGFGWTSLEVWQDGGIVRCGITWRPGGAGYEAAGGISGTISPPSRVLVNPGRVTSTEPLLAGHVAVWAARQIPAAPLASADAYGIAANSDLRSWDREAAHLRLARLCSEDRVALEVTGAPVDEGDVTRMGWQQPGTRLELYRQVEATDGGRLRESGFGLAYRPRFDISNQPVGLVIDASLRELGAPFAPDEDSDIVNDVTVRRPGGSSARAVTEGATEFVPDSYDVATSTDLVLADHAGWRLWLASVDEPRYQATINLHTPEGAALIEDWLALRDGDRWQIHNPPPQHPPGVVDQLLDGYTETWKGRRWWRVQLVGTPAGPWDVAEVDGAQVMAADGSTLDDGIDDTNMTLLLASTDDNGVWGTDPADFPLDVRIGGEKATASAVTGSSSPQTVTLSARGLNGVQRAWAAGTEVDVWLDAIVAL
ncbi:hypothetical protein [Polymorphospora rubra]|uniref:hypothetical protein n=1 Tax=Polymorphospora rubra TaxID=338584 RepID=UPI003404E36C